MNSLDTAATFHNDLQVIYDCEQRSLRMLPGLVEASHGEQLMKAYEDHFHETRLHVLRLENIFTLLDKPPVRKVCSVMTALLQKGNNVIMSANSPEVKDAALIVTSLEFEQYEITAYGSLTGFANELGHHEVTKIFQKTLDEENATQMKLAVLAEKVGKFIIARES